MGMTDRQFDVYLKGLLRELRDLEEELNRTASGVKLKKLETMIKDLEDQLKRP